MDFTTSSVQLYKQLASASRVLPTRSTMILQENVLFTVRKGEGDQMGVLQVLVADSELTLLASMPLASVRREGTIGVPHRILLETLKEFEDAPISFSADPNTLEITIVKGEGNDKGEFYMPGYSVSEFPELPELNAEQTMRFDTTCEAFLDYIARTIYAASKSDLTSLMSGILVVAAPEYLRFVATDANRIASLIDRSHSFPERREVFLPLRPASLLASILPSDDQPLQVEFDFRNMRLTGENFVLVCRLSDPMLPDYEKVIPLNNEYILKVERLPLMNLVRAVSHFSTKGNNIVTLQLSDNTMIASARDEDNRQRAFHSLRCEYKGNDHTVSFKTQYLLDSLAALSSPEVIITFSASATGSLFRPTQERHENEEIFSVVAKSHS